MGRGSGGGFSGGGHGGGGHSSMSHSGSGHSVGGGGGHRGGRGYSSPSRPSSSYHHHYHHNGYYGRPGYYGGPAVVHHHSKFYDAVCAILAIVIVAVALFTAMGGRMDGTKSTVDREKMSASLTSYISNPVEQQGWSWLGNAKATKKGIDKFTKETGVQPYVILTDGSDFGDTNSLEQYASEKYDDVFGNDLGHIIFVWYEGRSASNSNDGNGSPKLWIEVGGNARGVMDSEAQDIMFEYFDEYYFSNLSEDEMMGKVLTKTADKIMHKTPNYLLFIIIGGVVIVVAFIGYKALLAKHKREREEAAETERILNTPIETIPEPTDSFDSSSPPSGP